MTVKTSISLTGAQHAFAKKLVAKGDFASVSAVVQSGIEIMRKERAARDAEEKALKALIERRAKGPFVPLEEPGTLTDRIIAKTRAERGLPDRTVARRRA